MSRFVHSLAQMAVLVHMVCGCCWHHAHGCLEHADEPVAEAARCVGHDYDHDSCHWLLSSDGSLPDRDVCHAGRCDFVRSESDASYHPSLGSHYATTLLSAFVPADLAARQAAVPPGAALGSPLRLHLVIQKLLV